MSVLPSELSGDDRLDSTRARSPLADQLRDDDAHLVERSRRPGPIQRFKNVWAYRELLGNLTRLQLKVKYKNSVLGFLWSLLNPALYLAVFGFVFGVLMKNNVPDFALFLLSGLLAWNFFSTALMGGATSIVGSASLVTKVWFPREILPLASVGAAAFHLALQSLVLFLAMALFQRAPSPEYCLLLIPAIIVLILLSSALAIALSAVNVYLRDTQHLLELLLVAWFWGSAIVYPFALIHKVLAQHNLPDALAWLNPVIPIILVFQKALYNPKDVYKHALVNGKTVIVTTIKHGQTVPVVTSSARKIIPVYHSFAWYSAGLAFVFVWSVVMVFGALALFGRLEDNFAEEI